MFRKMARYYDRIYSFKDYRAETERLVTTLRAHLRTGGSRLLDVACGTGRHIEYLKAEFEVQGLDISEELLALACERNPAIVFHHGDMIDFDLGQQFDVVTCLFSSIGYVHTLENLARAVGCMARHLRPGGVVAIEPWFTPEAWHPGTVHAILIDEPALKLARVNTSFVDGRLSYFDLHYLVGTPEGTDHYVERHEMGLFTTDEMQAALAEAGLEATHDPEGLTGRGLWLGQRPA